MSIKLSKKDKLINEYKNSIELYNKNIKKSYIKIEKFKIENKLVGVKNFENGIISMTKSIAILERKLEDLLK